MTTVQGLRRRLLLGLLALASGAHGATPAAPKSSLLQRLKRITGIGLSPGQLRGSSVRGSIWATGIGGDEAPVRWSRDGGLCSPVFDAEGSRLYVLRGEELLRLDAPGSEPVRLQRLERATKLIGVSDGDLVYLRSDAKQQLGAWPLDGGEAQPLALDLTNDENRRLLSQMRGEARATERFVVAPRQQSREGRSGMLEWQDIVLQPRDGSAPRNLSRSGGGNCGQPALDPREERVAYVLADDI